MSITDPRGRYSVAPTSRLVADDTGFPTISLSTLRQLSDRERMMRPGTERAKLRARIALYVPALLDLIEETPLAPPDPGSARLSR